MKNFSNRYRFASILQGAVSAIALCTAGAAAAQGPDGAQDDSPLIVVNANIQNNAPAPGGALDSGITGIGQMTTRPNPATFGIGLCTGSLINPRTVIFAAHCVNSAPADAYGAEGGGIPISFGFSASNIEAIRQWIGLRDPANKYKSLPGFAIYNVEHVWYDERSLPTGFLEADVAIATLDAPAFGIPTWALLFSPLSEEAHATIVGYGGSSTNPLLGANQGIDFRRRIAENVVSFLGSLNDRNEALFGPGDYGLPQTLYNTDFDSPGGAESSDFVFQFDFDLFDGAALPNEGTTAGGDSGGPLIIDQAFDRPVVAGVLSGGSRFFGATGLPPGTPGFQAFSSYGTHSFYQPLFLFWDQIVANNPYKYATNKAGSADWTDPTHWVQTMDPNYTVIRDGALVNALPGAVGAGVSGDTTKFGNVCFLDDCQNFDRDGGEDAGTGAGLIVEGGPGSTNFVPNNIKADPANGIAPRYYDVTLAAAGDTRVTSTIQIDRFTLDGPASLDVKQSGSLTVLGDYNQYAGTTNVDGFLKTGEAVLLAGALTGRGVFDPTFLTVVSGAIAPGGVGDTGTLTIKGDLILSSGSLTQFDINRKSADLLAVTGDAQNAGVASLGGAAYFIKNGAAPRFGQSFTILTATGGIQGQFDLVAGKQGVLRPELSYGADNVIVTLRADSLADNLRGNSPNASAFASALDALRISDYSNLANLYGMIDVMDANALTATLNGLAPSGFGQSVAMNERQNGLMIGLISDRLSLLATDSLAQGGFSVLGAPETLTMAIDQTDVTMSSAAQFGMVGRASVAGRSAGNLPEGVTGFISGGVERGSAQSRFANAGTVRDGWHLAMGLEMEASSRFTIGAGVASVHGVANMAGGEVDLATSQAALYGSYRLGLRGYVAGFASASVTDIALNQRQSILGTLNRYGNDSTATNFDLGMEVGANLPVAQGLRLTPRAGLRYTSNSIDGYSERGADALLQVGDVRQQRLEGRAGVALAGAMKLAGGWQMTPQLSADHVQVLDQGASDLTVRFLSASAVPIRLTGLASDGSWSEARGGLTLQNGLVSFTAAFETEIGRSDFADNRAVAEMRLRF